MILAALLCVLGWLETVSDGVMFLWEQPTLLVLIGFCWYGHCYWQQLL